MSNLGWYQGMTTIAKKVGGPKNFVGLLLGCGAVVGVVVVKGVEKIADKVSDKKAEKKRLYEASTLYSVEKDCCSNEGLDFSIGDTFKVLEKDGNAVLIELSGGTNNPYFVSSEFLSSISNYK